MHCTQCGAEAQGRFCASCGASLQPLSCRGCGSKVAAGNRFCTSCGTPVGGPTARGARTPAESAVLGVSQQKRGADAGWWIGGGLLAVVLVIVGVGVLMDSEEGSLPPGSSAGLASRGGTPPDLSSMTPREAADRLFNRVMTAAAREDVAEANSFLPMAIDAYGLAQPLDDDGLFHLALLQRAGGEHEESLASALEGLQENPDHLLNLSAAAEASLQLGQVEAGREYYQRVLDSWEGEMAAGREEYDEHGPLLPMIREDAEAFLSGGSGP